MSKKAAISNSDSNRRSPRQILLGSAILGALFTYLAFASLTSPLLDLLYPLPWYDPNYAIVPLLIAVAGAAGIGLRWLARRYTMPAVQAGALVGALIMTGVGVWAAGTRFGEYASLGKAVVAVPVGLVLIFMVSRITATPSKGPRERSGTSLLWRAIFGQNKETDEEGKNRSGSIEESPSNIGTHETGGPVNWRQVLSLSRYWRVVGGAFAICIPLALVNTELGIGLLSTFLTAYGLSYRIEPESGGFVEER